MSISPESAGASPAPIPSIRRIAPEQPWLWLAAGFRDFMRAPVASVLYGVAIAAISLGLTALLGSMDRLPLLLPLLAGFALVSPFLAVGLYGISRTLEEHRTVNAGTVLASLSSRSNQIGLVGALFLLINIAWVRIATLLFALFFAQTPVSLPDLLDLFLRSDNGFLFLVVGTAIGALFAFGTFALSAISLPMLLDQDVSVVAALRTSWTAVALNPIPMGLWAVLIVLGVLLGFVTFFVALIFVMPLIGYATWHAYRDLVLPPEHGTISRITLLLVETN